MLDSCVKGKHLEDGQCVENTLDCPSDKHEYKGECEDDSMQNCGEHGNQCESIKGWKEGSCIDGQCIISACANDLVLSNNICAEKDSKNDSSNSTPDDCSGNPTSGTSSLPCLWMISFAVLAVIRRRRSFASKA